MQKKRIIYYGQVQGVGFRKTVLQCGKNLPLKGYVRNLTDGSVELVVLGDQEDIQTLCHRINERMYSHITKINETQYTGDESFENFVIRH